MTVPAITAARLTGAAHRAQLPLLVLGPAPGTSAAALWTECAAGLTDVFDVVAWDLPGQGYNYSVPEDSFTTGELAAGVLRVLEDVLEQRDQLGGSFAYAGDSVGGCVGLQLLLDHPGRVSSAVLLCTASELDIRDRLGEIDAPVLAVAGSEDAVTPPEGPREIADGVGDGRLVVLDGVGHLAPAEAPVEVARLIRQHVLGDAHVDVTDEFQDLVNEYAEDAGGTRPGLDGRSRSLITLSALIAQGRLEELELHLRAARSNGLSNDEIRELIVRTAIHGGVPDADTAFRIAQRVLSEIDGEESR